MPIQIFPKEKQGQGAFNGGQIVENKPVGFPQDHSTLRPFSNLFYWAHARAVTDSTIGLHPHQGFEICSFILKGPVRHYDTKLREWKPLESGDVQIIRAGNGIAHSEFMGKDSEMFQIWFDPNLQQSISKSASYDDYRASDFPLNEGGHFRETILIGAGSPFRMDTPGVGVRRVRLDSGQYEIQDLEGQIGAVYLIEGEALVNGELAKSTDFVLMSGAPKLTFESLGGADIFVMTLPQTVDYQTYASRMRA